MSLTTSFLRRRETGTKVLEGADEVGDVLPHGLTVFFSLRGHLAKLGKLLSLMKVLEPLSNPKVRLRRPPIALGLATLLVEVVHLLLLRSAIVPSVRHVLQIGEYLSHLGRSTGLELLLGIRSASAVVPPIATTVAFYLVLVM